MEKVEEEKEENERRKGEQNSQWTIFMHHYLHKHLILFLIY